MSQNEKAQIDYDFLIEYFNTELNAIGATTSLTLRTVDTIAGDTAYVRKFGTGYLITSVSDIEDPVDPNMKFLVYDLSGTLMGSRIGGAPFVAGSTGDGTGCYLEIEASGGAVTVLASITIDTDIDAGGLAFTCVAETVANGDTLRLYLSDTSSTYYSSDYVHGGARHTPALNNTRLPYRTQNLALASIVTANNDGCVTLDSESYDEEIDWNLADSFCLAAIGQTPTITRGIGARITRFTFQEYNNLTATYFNNSGSDTTGDGTWQNPYKTPNFAINNVKNIYVVFGGNNATNNEFFELNVTLSEDISLESDYKFISNYNAVGTDSFISNDETTVVRGIVLIGNNKLTTQGLTAASTGEALAVEDSEIYDCDIAVRDVTSITLVIINNSLLHDNNTAYYHTGTALTQSDVDVYNNIFYNNDIGVFSVAADTTGSEIDVYNNVFYNNTTGIKYTSANPVAIRGSVVNNTFNNNDIGLNLDGTNTGSFNFNIDNNIFRDHNTSGIKSLGTTNKTINNNCFYINVADLDGNFTNNNPVNADPELCSIVNGHYGIKPSSPCYRAGTDSDDIGIKTRIMEINESNITINGMTIDGQTGYSAGLFLLDTVNHTDLIMKWCTVKDCIGGGGDFYDDDTNLDFQILNCDFNNNGYGIGLHYGGNIIQESLFYKNSAQQLFISRLSNTINHCIFYGGEYGIYNDSNFAVVKNCIIDSNSLYGIYSASAMSSITYSNITSGVNSTVDISDSTNINTEPLFINVITGQENFNIKTKETNILDDDGNVIDQYQTNSGCKDASDGVLYDDIGAYGVDRGIEELAWKKYEFEYNPSNLNDQNMPIDPIEFNDALGVYSSWAKAHRIRFPLIWSENHATSVQQNNKIKYFNSLRQSRELGKTKDSTRLRFKRLPVSFLASGSNGIISASGKTMTDSAGTYDEDELKGYWLAIKLDTRVNFVISASGKTATSSGAGWTVNEHEGRFLKYNGLSYYIKSNTSEVLSLSDPYSTLVDASAQTLSIELYFEIKTNTGTVFTLYDEDSELIDGTYDYYVDFAITRSVVQDFITAQAAYNPDIPEWNTGYSLNLQQI
jgi:hypothetical protein